MKRKRKRKTNNVGFSEPHDDLYAFGICLTLEDAKKYRIQRQSQP